MPETQQEPINIDLDANDVINRASQYDPNLIQRVIAELQRDKLAEMLQGERDLKKKQALEGKEGMRMKDVAKLDLAKDEE